MCIQCEAECFEWGEPVPGFALVRARRAGGGMKPGDWGLVESNDPFHFWSTALPPPLPDEDESPEAEELFERMCDEVESWNGTLFGDPDRTLRLGLAAIKEGYDPPKHGRLGFWLYERVARVMAAPAPAPTPRP